MATSFILMTEAECFAARALDVPDSGIAFGGRIIDNSLANNIGHGTLVGGATDYYVNDARLLNDPEYQHYRAVCENLPIITVDPDVLFVPPPPLD